MDQPLPFQGFPGAMTFLRALAAHNDRAWFAGHKATYEQALRRPAEAFVAAIQPPLEAIAGQALKPRVSRIHRDVRFSKDKSPYHTRQHIGFMAASDDGQRHGTGYYFGFDTERVTVGAGGFDLEGAALDRFRAAVADDSDGAALSALLSALGRDGARLPDPALKRTPAPYPADHPRAELLRHKGLSVWRDLDEGALDGPGVVDEALAAFRKLHAVNAWIDGALG